MMVESRNGEGEENTITIPIMTEIDKASRA
jgi:hypothetical protein